MKTCLAEDTYEDEKGTVHHHNNGVGCVDYIKAYAHVLISNACGFNNMCSRTTLREMFKKDGTMSFVAEVTFDCFVDIFDMYLDERSAGLVNTSNSFNFFVSDWDIVTTVQNWEIWLHNNELIYGFREIKKTKKQYTLETPIGLNKRLKPFLGLAGFVFLTYGEYAYMYKGRRAQLRNIIKSDIINQVY